MYEKLRRKISTTVEVYKIMYGKYPISAISRDALSAGVTIALLYAVTISGKFIDATAEIFSNWNSFSWEEYFLTVPFTILR
jgi:hypothetical protein